MSCAEIRRVFWQVIIAVERPSAHVLQWSGWRRGHQAGARYHHYRRRAKVVRVTPGAPTVHPPPPNADVVGIDRLWSGLELLLPPLKRNGRPYTHERRIVLEAIVHVLQTDCGWRHLPARFPPWQTVYTQFTQWRVTGIWGKIWNAEGAGHTEQQLQL